MIAEAVRLAFHGLDLGVGALQRACGDGVVVVGKDAAAVFVHRGGELFQHRDLRGASAGDPILENAPSGVFVALLPDLPQILLEIVGDGQGATERQSVSIADGAPRRVQGRTAASTAPGLGIIPKEEVLGKAVVDVS